MRALLVAVNAKYIHSNLAVYSLRAYALARGVEVGVAEYTVNQRVDDVVAELYKKQPDWLGFSCYIWNIDFVKAVAKTLRKVMPKLAIWFGGPEVSYDAKELLERETYVDGVMLGEGEGTLASLLARFHREGVRRGLAGLEGVAYREKDGGVWVNPPANGVDLDELPFPYDEELEEGRILYYESSRGCPFSCSYCLSCVGKRVRGKSLEKVKAELAIFLSRRVGMVKFVDRTFNLEGERAKSVWEFLRDNDNGVTNFHFEIAADLLREEDVALFRTMRKGQVQLEIGVQSTNGKTLEAVRRKTDWKRIQTMVARVKEAGGVHQHLDLIAGLPYEDFQGVRASFRDVYRLKPEKLQLGFLKLLKGAPLREEASHYGITYRTYPPYEFLSTRWLSYADVLRIKRVEEMVEVYYNGGQFKLSLSFLERLYDNPFDLFEELGEYRAQRYDEMASHARMQYYEALLAFYKERFGKDADAFAQLLVFDSYLREKLKKRPAFAGEEDREGRRAFFGSEENRKRYVPNYASYDAGQVARMTHYERFRVDVFRMAERGEVVRRDLCLLFDYRERDPLSNDARVVELEKGKGGGED